MLVSEVEGFAEAITAIKDSREGIVFAKGLRDILTRKDAASRKMLEHDKQLVSCGYRTCLEDMLLQLERKDK